MNHGESLRLRIEPGSTLLRKLRRGSRITTVTGAVRVDGPPQWLAERVVRAAWLVHPGMPITLARTGWVALSSDLGAHVLFEFPARPISMLAALGELVRRLQRRIGASSPSQAA